MGPVRSFQEEIEAFGFSYGYSLQTEIHTKKTFSEERKRKYSDGQDEYTILEDLLIGQCIQFSLTNLFFSPCKLPYSPELALYLPAHVGNAVKAKGSGGFLDSKKHHVLQVIICSG